VEAREPAVGLDEGFLGEVVGQRMVAPREMAEKVAHGGLVAVDQFPERGVVVGDEHAGDQFGVGHVKDGRRAGVR
jgi:hypothetical protein